MHKCLGLVLSNLAIAAIASPAFAQPVPDAVAEIRDAQGNAIGNAYFISTPDGVQIQMRLEEFDSAVAEDERGQHGFHIHEVGECNPPDFMSAGSHFNPTGTAHGLLAPDGPHAGDLPNLWIEADGSADYSVTTNLISLVPGERNIFDADGSSLVIHATGDDYITDPAGNSGDRIACGVIVPAQ
ncbi:MAG: superoxide dismutase family protein [Synechococcales bacterium]|nr:superoxide dismutase family protein [Synechococcales bacterium]